MRPLAIDLFCGLGGWTEGLLAEGYRVVGFDTERHVYGQARYPAQLVLQDVLTIHGSQFASAALIVASPPCQAYSYRAMPWKRAKALPPPDNSLFDACFRIQAEAIEVSGRFIPLVVENVCGAQKWVGRAKWHFGSFYLWGDVPALMPITRKAVKVATMGAGWYPPDHPKHVPGLAFNGHAERNLRNDTHGQRPSADAEGRSLRPSPSMVEGPIESTTGGGESHRSVSEFSSAMHGGLGFGIVERDRSPEGVKAGDRNRARASGGHEWTTGFDKHRKNDGGSGIAGPRKNGKGDAWFQDGAAKHGSKSSARKAASAHIAKIPRVLARHIARAWHPQHAEGVSA